MEAEYDALIGSIQDKAVEKILDWAFSDDHPLNQCTDEVKGHVKHASTLAAQGRYGEALEELARASDKDPQYVGARVRAMKYLIKDERPLLGLLIGGGVLVLANDEKSQNQVWDLASGVALDVFKQTQERKYLAEALNFADAATRLAPDDVLSNWNRVEILLLYSKNMREEGQTEQADRLEKLAKGALEAILDTGKNHRGNASRYWSRLIDDAGTILPEDPWWRVKLSEFRDIGERLEDDLDQDIAPEVVSASKNSTGRQFGWEAVRVLTMLVVLAYPDLLGAFPTGFSNEDVRPPKEVVRLYEPSQPPYTAGRGMAANDRFIRVDRDDEELALTRSILDGYAVRVERDDEELV